MTRAFAHDRLKAIRLERDVSQDRLARELGVTVRGYVRWERGEGGPSGAYLTRLCLWAGKPVEWFYPEVEDEANGEAA